MIDFQKYLKPTPYLNYNNEVVISFIKKHTIESDNINEKALQLYYAVRDEIRYDPYLFSSNSDDFKASYVIQSGRSWCVPKSILYAATCRYLGIPARLGYADVKNHLSTAKMRDHMKTDTFYWHGYTSVYLYGKWVKATPVFNRELCEKFGLKPLEFDGRQDSIYHSFDRQGRKHMEYLNERGTYEDLPLNEMLSQLSSLYPHLNSSADLVDFDQDVDKEHQ